MNANTESALRAIIATDPGINPGNVDIAIRVLKGLPIDAQPSRVVSPKDASLRLGVSTRTLRSWATGGRIRRIMAGADADGKRAVGYDSASIDALFAGGHVPGLLHPVTP